jgi:hypothetical protein
MDYQPVERQAESFWPWMAKRESITYVIDSSLGPASHGGQAGEK